MTVFKRRRARQCARILEVLDASQAGLYGPDLARLAKVSSVSLYPCLEDLERAGEIEATFEPAPIRPQRRIYTRTSR